MFVFIYPKMALSGLERERKKSMQIECNCGKRVCLSIYSRRRCGVVSSSNLQRKKELKRDQTFLTLKSNLLRYEMLFKILYWNIIVAVSIATVLGITCFFKNCFLM